MDDAQDRGNAHDLELARQVCAGSRPAFEKVFEAYADAVYALALRRCGPERAEGVARAALASAFEQLADYRGTVSLAAWMRAHALRSVASADASAPRARRR